jgi:long-chain acyl-CoA synthetase
LRGIGVKHRENVVLYSETRAEFYLADQGIMAAGATAAALYTSYPVPDLIDSIRACAARYVFVEDPAALEQFRKAGADGLSVRWILLSGHAKGIMALDELREIGRKAMEKDRGLFKRIQTEYTVRDHAILYLTSGATGKPKMGLVSHAAVVSNLDMGPAVLDIGPHDVTLAFLPSAHITQRLVVELLPMRMGSPVWFSESLNQLPHEIKSVRPTWFVAPPRLWERVYTTICTEIRKRPMYQRKMFYGALGLGLEASRLRQEGKPLPVWISQPLKAANRLVFRKIRDRFGGRLKLAASGSAPLGPDLARFYSAVGLPLIEGYGLTEGGIVAFNPSNRPKAGSIGKPIPGTEVKIGEDGELLVKSPCLFDGYYHDPDATAKVLRDGWLYTGDIAEIDGDGYLYITGRKKELIVSSTGKKIYPSKIETLLKTEPIINQVLLIGDRMPYVTALLSVNAPDSQAAVPAVKQAVDRVNRQLAAFEQVRKFRVIDREFSIEHGELTPTLKVRRQAALENFRTLIQEMY